MMILSPVITLKDSPPPRKFPPARDVLVGTLLAFAGLGILALAASRKAAWN